MSLGPSKTNYVCSRPEYRLQVFKALQLSLVVQGPKSFTMEDRLCKYVHIYIYVFAWHTVISNYCILDIFGTLKSHVVIDVFIVELQPKSRDHHMVLVPEIRFFEMGSRYFQLFVCPVLTVTKEEKIRRGPGDYRSCCFWHMTFEECQYIGDISW